MSTEAYALFLQEVRNALYAYKFSADDIEYINYDGSYWVEAGDFFSFEAFPSVVATKFSLVSWCNNWDVPQGFKIVMKDGTILLYHTVSDEYYNTWICVPTPNKSPIQITK